ncbi:DUF192 domain-containing protein [Niveibacterium sp. SC-1]|uniref:DUF192 domain-containing protein n=1 Tax=Niveibacterium sp. SC-1 TaxID=3135646 RepID=UPI00311DFF43
MKSWAKVALILAAVSGVAHAQEFRRADLSAGLFRIDAEIAATPAERERGLMFRENMPPNRGMLFVFDEEGRHCMWMKNTPLPLSVAFLDAGGRILNVEDMRPRTEDSHCAAGDARYALEMNDGWFKQRKLAAGAQISGVKDAASRAR